MIKCNFVQKSHEAKLAHHKNVLCTAHRDDTPSCVSHKSDVSAEVLHRLARHFAMWRDHSNCELQFSILADFYLAGHQEGLSEAPFQGQLQRRFP